MKRRGTYTQIDAETTTQHCNCVPRVILMTRLVEQMRDGGCLAHVEQSRDKCAATCRRDDMRAHIFVTRGSVQAFLPTFVFFQHLSQNCRASSQALRNLAVRIYVPTACALVCIRACHSCSSPPASATTPTVTGKLAEMFASPDLLRWISTQKMGFLGSTIMISIRCCCISMKYMQVAAFLFSLATGGLPGQLGGPSCLFSHVWLSIRGGKRESKYRASCLWALKSASSRDRGWALANSMSMRSP